MNLILRRFRNLLQHAFVRKLLLVLFTVLFYQTVHHLTFLQAAVSDRRKNRVPILESIFPLDDLLIPGNQNLAWNDRFRPAVIAYQFFASDNILFFEFLLEPLVDLILSLGTLDNIQPVAAGALGILGRQDLYPVAVLDLIINIHQFSVHPGSYHLIAHRTVDRIGKINRRRAVRKVLDVSLGCKTVYILRKEVQIPLDQAHEFPVIRHVSLPFQDLPKPA